ncbi:MAG: hypothetical protein RL346_968 [Verrucomicrobiota bacterium]|jgi:hypothetical protein
MNDQLKHQLAEMDKDLSSTWIHLSQEVRRLAEELKRRTHATVFSDEADRLAQNTARLCDHVEKLHSDVADLIDHIEIHIPLHESDAESSLANPDPEALAREKIQIQRENHELRNDFKDILKALFMWVDDPKDRLRSKQP